MSLVIHFLLGFITSFVGTIPPSMLNMTTAKISIERAKNEAVKFAVGVSLVVFIQAYIAVFFAKYIHNNADIEWYITVFGIVIFAVLSIYFFHQAKAEKKEVKKFRLKSSLLAGITLSLLNMFAIPFYCGVSSALNMSGWLSFNQSTILLFVIGSTLGTFSLLYVYAYSAIKISKKAHLLTKNLNYILSALTGIVALITLFKII